ncbi:MAG TPA: hypothetical protein VFJ74_10535, partial [Gemmatimonadaceae bacterium]|nr:hypothetical protein [Gemmatimonadaceae bacterium]
MTPPSTAVAAAARHSSRALDATLCDARAPFVASTTSVARAALALSTAALLLAAGCSKGGDTTRDG